MKLSKKNIGDLVWVKWRDHSSSSAWKAKDELTTSGPVTIGTFGIYYGKTKHEEIIFASRDLYQDSVNETMWILKPDIVYVKVILRSKEVAKL